MRHPLSQIAAEAAGIIERGKVVSDDELRATMTARHPHLRHRWHSLVCELEKLGASRGTFAHHGDLWGRTRPPSRAPRRWALRRRKPAPAPTARPADRALATTLLEPTPLEQATVAAVYRRATGGRVSDPDAPLEQVLAAIDAHHTAQRATLRRDLVNGLVLTGETAAATTLARLFDLATDAGAGCTHNRSGSRPDVTLVPDDVAQIITDYTQPGQGAA